MLALFIIPSGSLGLLSPFLHTKARIFSSQGQSETVYCKEVKLVWQKLATEPVF